MRSLYTEHNRYCMLGLLQSVHTFTNDDERLVLTIYSVLKMFKSTQYLIVYIGLSYELTNYSRLSDTPLVAVGVPLRALNYWKLCASLKFPSILIFCNCYHVPTKKKNLLQLCGLAKQLDMTERQIERWWRLRRSQAKPSTLVKFCENSWKCTFYICNFAFGLYILWDKEWLWDIDQCYIGYPHQVSFAI